MSKVYVPQEPVKFDNGARQLVTTMDLTPCLEYGEVVYLLSTGPAMLMPGPTGVTLNHALRNFNDADYILPIGDPSLIGLVAMVAAKYNNGRVKFLKWDKQSSRYYVINTEA